VNQKKFVRKLPHRRVADIWRDGQIYEAQGMKHDDISQLVGLGVGNWSRFKRIVSASLGEVPYGIDPENRRLAKELLVQIDTGNLSYAGAYRAFQRHLIKTEQPVFTKTPGSKKPKSEEKVLELYNRAVLTMEGSAYAISKLPDWSDAWAVDKIEEYIDRLSKARKVLEQKINSLRRATNNAQAQSQDNSSE
jgi:hypothetical protein